MWKILTKGLKFDFHFEMKRSFDIYKIFKQFYVSLIVKKRLIAIILVGMHCSHVTRYQPEVLYDGNGNSRGAP